MDETGSNPTLDLQPLEPGTVQYLTFTIGRQVYGVPRALVRDIVPRCEDRMQPLPTAPRGIAGAVRDGDGCAPGDRVIPVVDLQDGYFPTEVQKATRPFD
jgi:chemotaxis signal transduction protein